MRIGRLEKNQHPSETPNSYISKGRALKFLARKIARWVIPDKILQMLKDDEEIRGDARFLQAQIDTIYRIKPPRRPEGLLLWYPHKDQFTRA